MIATYVLYQNRSKQIKNACVELVHSFNRHGKGHTGPFFQRKEEKRSFNQSIHNQVIKAHYLTKRKRKEVLVQYYRPLTESTVLYIL